MLRRKLPCENIYTLELLVELTSITPNLVHLGPLEFLKNETSKCDVLHFQEFQTLYLSSNCFIPNTHCHTFVGKDFVPLDFTNDAKQVGLMVFECLGVRPYSSGDKC